MKKLKSKRAFLEKLTDSDSYYRLEVDSNGYVALKLSDCDRRIQFHFGVPGEKRAIKKIKRLKAVIDEMHDFLVGDK